MVAVEDVGFGLVGDDLAGAAGSNGREVLELERSRGVCHFLFLSKFLRKTKPIRR